MMLGRKGFQFLVSRSSSICRNRIYRHSVPAVNYVSCSRTFNELSPKIFNRPTFEKLRVNRFLSGEQLMNLNEYNDLADETLEELADHFEDLAEDGLFSEDFDCILADGVITTNLGEHGVYVINKQAPNRQLWLSSPISGPKRYDFSNNAWIYSHDGITLHELLSSELSSMLSKKVDFTHLVFGKIGSN